MSYVNPEIRDLTERALGCGLPVPVEISLQNAAAIQDESLESIRQIDSYMDGLYEPEDNHVAHIEMAKAVKQLVVARNIRQILSLEIRGIAA